MSDERKSFKLITPYGEEIASITGTDAEVQKAIIAIGESLLNTKDLTAENVHALTAIGEYLWEQGKATPEDLAAAKKFFEAAEKFGDPQATDYLSCLQKNPLVSGAMWLRAADRGAPSPINNLIEDYSEQAAYWRKKIADAEGKSFEEEDIPTDEEILQSDRLKFFDIYKRAFDGDLDAMKICLEFCEKEQAYWLNRD